MSGCMHVCSARWMGGECFQGPAVMDVTTDWEVLVPMQWGASSAQPSAMPWLCRRSLSARRAAFLPQVFPTLRGSSANFSRDIVLFNFG